MIKSAYIHIPFCSSKCKYCSFVSYTELSEKQEYLNALEKQIISEYRHEKLDTLYLGGGTPSLLSYDEIEGLLSLFNFKKHSEVTIEVNPDSADYNFLSKIRKLGVNRLSIGSQTFDNKILKSIGRIHSSEQIYLAVEVARAAGFDNISLDFIYGLPMQTLEGFINDIKQAVSLNVEHVSLYGLKIEEGCFFHSNPPQLIADSDVQADMYLSAVEFLKTAGFEHYEVSNFSRNGFSSRHNLNYWNNSEYYGFGCSASGYVDGIRYQNQDDLNEYIENSLKKIFEHKVSNQEMLEEAIFLGLRKITGLNINELNKRFNIDFNKKYSYILKKYSEYFVKTLNGWSLNINGVLVSNQILSEFIAD